MTAPHVSFLIDAALYAATVIRDGIQDRVRAAPSGSLRGFVVSRPAELPMILRNLGAIMRPLCQDAIRELLAKPFAEFRPAPVVQRVGALGVDATVGDVSVAVLIESTSAGRLVRIRCLTT